MWLLCYPNETLHNAAVLLPISVLVGMVWAAVNLAQFNIILATSPPEERASYISVALTVQNVVGFVSPLIGAVIMAALRNRLGNPTEAYKLLFGITMGLRFLSIFTIAPVMEQGAIRVRTTLRDLTRITPRGYSAMRSLSRSIDVTEREVAIQRVAEQGVSMAVDELIKSLHDPSPRIRRQASVGLARLGDPAAVQALLHQLADHPDLVEDETIDALGQLAGPEAVGPITKLLQDPRSLVRRAAVRALGRIGDPAAVPDLIAIAQTGDTDIRRAALRSLWNLGAGEVEDIFAQSLLDPAPSVRIAAAEGVSEMCIRSARLQAIDSLQTYHDEASSEVAYAMGTIGSDEDIPMILDTASQCISMITRRRCLLGVAKLLGVEAAAYRLLLLDGMSRDTTLMAMVRPLSRKSKRIAVAFEKYSAGDEAGAISAVAHAIKQPILHFMARQPVDELFLIVVCYLGKP